MRKGKFVGTLLVTCLFFVAPLALADVPDVQAECFKEELRDFVKGMQAVPHFAVSAGEAPAQVDSLNEVELLALQGELSAIPNWRDIPAVVASIADSQEMRKQQLLARFVELTSPQANAAPDTTVELARFKDDLIFLLNEMRKFAPMMGNDYDARVLKTLRAIESFAPADLGPMRDYYYTHMANRFVGGQSVAVPGAGRIGSLAERPIQGMGCDTDCGIDVVCWGEAVVCLIEEVGSFFSNVISQIGSLFTSIGELPGKIATFFTGLFDRVKTLLSQAWNAILALLPDSLQDVVDALAALGLNIQNFNWASIASSIPNIAPPCPQQAVVIAAEVCDRGGNALTELAFTVAPEDGLGLPLKLIFAAIHFPLSYLCNCADIEEALEFDEAQADHRDLTEDNLNAKVSTRARQVSLNDLRASLHTLNVDIEFKLDRKMDLLEAKADSLAAAQGDQGVLIGDFRRLLTRIDIEETMLKSKMEVISTYQLPMSFGGHLELVGAIVDSTIRMNNAAGQATFGADQEWLRGNALMQVGDFVRAYEAYRSAYHRAIDTGGDNGD